MTVPHQNQILTGDCAVVLRQYPDDSFDAVVTDPPQGLNILGSKGWDLDCPSVEIWKEIFRVMKPGTFAFVISAARADLMARMIARLADAGFKVDLSPVYYCHNQGFSHHLNVGKYVADHMGPDVAPHLAGAYGGFQPKPAVEPVLVAMKPLRPLCRSQVYEALKGKCDYVQTRDVAITALNKDRISKRCGFPIAAGNRLVMRLALNPFKSDQTLVLYPDGKEQVVEETPFVDEDASGYVSAALVAGTGVTWLDDARIPVSGGKSATAKPGRFPGNVLVSDDALDDGTLYRACGAPADGHSVGYDDEGTFSRFFSLDLWWDKALTRLPANVRRTFPFLICPKPGEDEKNAGLGVIGEVEPEVFVKSGKKKARDVHPSIRHPGAGRGKGNEHSSVKALALMSWLTALATREGQVVLDPFCGSGTTCVAAALWGRKFVGIELDQDFAEIGRKRLDAEAGLLLFAQE